MNQKESRKNLLHTYRYYMRVWIAVVKKSLSKHVAYRFELTSKLFRAALVLGIQILVVESVFQGADRVAGWEVDQFYLLVGIYNVINYLSWGVFNVNFWRIEQKVLKGEFDFLLLMPTGSVFSASFTEFYLDDAVGALGGLVLIIYYFIMNYSEITLLSLFGAGVAIVIAWVLWFSIHLLVVSFDFVSVKNGLLELLKSLTRVGGFPPEIFPPSFRIILYSIFPVAFIAAIPARVLTGFYNWEVLVLGGIVALLMFYLARKVWYWAIRSYTSAGG